MCGCLRGLLPGVVRSVGGESGVAGGDDDEAGHVQGGRPGGGLVAGRDGGLGDLGKGGAQADDLVEVVGQGRWKSVPYGPTRA